MGFTVTVIHDKDFCWLADCSDCANQHAGHQVEEIIVLRDVSLGFLLCVLLWTAEQSPGESRLTDFYNGTFEGGKTKAPQFIWIEVYFLFEYGTWWRGTNFTTACAQLSQPVFTGVKDTQEVCSSPLITFVALLWTRDNRFMVFLCLEPLNWMQYSR